jgi:hypothetical protein
MTADLRTARPHRRRTLTVRLVWLLVVAASLAAVLPADVGTAATATQQHRGPGCAATGKAFRPTGLAIPGVIDRRTVLALGRDRHGVPQTPPLTDKGKQEFGWDRESRIGAGSPHGVVRLTAHTYPKFAGLALGNRLLARLHKGATLVVTGARGQRQCYRVSQRLSVPARRTVPAYYDSTGAPRLAIAVCSGKRLGPGHWTRRTIWFATPLG